MRKPQVTSVLVGASSTKQLTDNMNCLKGAEFAQEELKVIDEILEGQG